MEDIENSPSNLNTQNEVVSPDLDSTLTSSQQRVKKSNIKVIVFIIAIGFILVGLGGYYLGSMSSESKIIDSVLSNDKGEVFCTEDARLCSDGSSVGRVGPNCEFEECPFSNNDVLDNINVVEDEIEVSEAWERKQYSSNNKVVWDISQPQQTKANEAGLHEGYLGLNSFDDDGNKLMAEFSFPIFFDAGIPKSFEEWIDMYMEVSLGDTFVDREVIPLNHSQDVQIKMIKTTSISPGGIKDSRMPMYFILIWKHERLNGRNVNPSIISVKPDGDLSLDDNVVRSFAAKLVQGIRF